MKNKRRIVSACCRKEQHEWCANRNYEEVHCECICHSAKPVAMTLEEVVQAFLETALTSPEKPPKQLYLQRENRAQLIGFSRAQELLRDFLTQAGFTKLAEFRNPKQIQPEKIGDHIVYTMP